MSELPEIGFLRLPQVLKLIPMGKSCWYKGIQEGVYPKPIRIRPHLAVWKVEDIRSLIESLGSKDQNL